MRNFFDYLGPRNTVLLITVLATIGTISITSVSYALAGLPLNAIHLLIAALMAVILAPALGIPVVSQLFKIAALEEENHQLATYDKLTGLLTRNAFIGQAEAYIKFAIRNRSSFALFFIDIDNFKAVNDNHGHGGGDKLLKELGATLISATRDSDLAGRYGGDEFVILLLDTDQPGAQFLIDKIQDGVSQIVIGFEDVKVKISVSIGVTIVQSATEGLTLGECIKQSDQALYQAKKAGRNCTAFFNTASENLSQGG